MLTIIYGDVENSIYNTNVYFKNTYEPEWIESELAKKIIKDVDDSDVLSLDCRVSASICVGLRKRIGACFLSDKKACARGSGTKKCANKRRAQECKLDHIKEWKIV